MTPNLPVPRIGSTGRFSAAGLALLMLGGCGGGGGDGLFGTGIGARRSTTEIATGEGGGTLTTARNYLLYGSASPPPPAATTPGQREINCPKVQVLDGTAAMRIGSVSGSASEVSYQASLGETARECRIDGNNVTLKVGVEGRLLIGALGKPGNYVVPLRIVVKREKEVLVSRLARISVTVPQGDSQASFTHVEEGISVPLTENDPAEEYDLLVGFDPNGKDPNAKAEPKRRKRKG